MIQDTAQAKSTLSSLDKYFSKLELTGYVRQGEICKLLTYLFLLDFIGDVFANLSISDYNKFNELLMRLRNSDSCLLPYEYACKNRSGRRSAVIGSQMYVGPFVRRVAEEDDIPRITEDENPRTTE